MYHSFGHVSRTLVSRVTIYLPRLYDMEVALSACDSFAHLVTTLPVAISTGCIQLLNQVKMTMQPNGVARNDNAMPPSNPLACFSYRSLLSMMMLKLVNLNKTSQSKQHIALHWLSILLQWLHVHYLSIWLPSWISFRFEIVNEINVALKLVPSKVKILPHSSVLCNGLKNQIGNCILLVDIFHAICHLIQDSKGENNIVLSHQLPFHKTMRQH